MSILLFLDKGWCILTNMYQCDEEGPGVCQHCGMEVFPPMTSEEAAQNRLDVNTVKAYKQKVT